MIHIYIISILKTNNNITHNTINFHMYKHAVDVFD